jgi:hypothetical protein
VINQDQKVIDQLEELEELKRKNLNKKELQI